MGCILGCVHQLNGKRIENKIWPAVLISLWAVWMEGIELFDMDRRLVFLYFGIVTLYCVFWLGWRGRTLAVNTVLYILLVSALQAFGALLSATLPFEQEEARFTFIHAVAFGIVVWIFPRLPIQKLSLFFREKCRVLEAALLLCLLFVSLFVVRLRMTGYASYGLCFMIAAGIGLTCYMGYRWQQSQERVHMAVRMFQEYKTGTESYRELLGQIREKQHDYKNLINAIWCQHVTCKTYEELVSMQRRYCAVLMEDAVAQDIPDTGDQMLSAFLYGKMREAKEKGIVISCKGRLVLGKEPVDVIDQIEVMGNLLDNAVEELEEKGIPARIIVQETTSRAGIGFVLGNPIAQKESLAVERLTQRGYSTKGEGRGYGLGNVVRICEKHGWKLVVDIQAREETDWLLFQVLR